MRTKKLEQYYQDYIMTVSLPDAITEDICLLYSSEQFHINFKNKTVYFYNLGVIKIQEIDKAFQKPDWAALIQDKKTSQHHFVVGNGNPYSEQYLNILPLQDGFFTAIPCSISNDPDKLISILTKNISHSLKNAQ